MIIRTVLGPYHRKDKSDNLSPDSGRLDSSDIAGASLVDPTRSPQDGRLASLVRTRYRIIVPLFALAAVAGTAGCGSEADLTTIDADASAATDTEGTTDVDDSDHDGEENHDNEAGTALGAHEHGVAELSVAWSEGEMVVDLISPTYNIFGFEYEPTTDEDMALVADRTEALSAPGVLSINAEAGCTLADEITTDLEYEGNHAELTASWLFVCESPDEIKELDAAALFAEFPNLEDIDAQWASDSGQSSAELSPSATILELG